MFDSFLLAGFEGTTGRNARDEPVDQVRATQHDEHVDEDYAAVAALGIRAARECVRWPLCDRGGRLDFGSYLPMLRAARRHRLVLVHDLFHFGYPEDLHPFEPEFLDRFAAYAGAAARFIRRHSAPPYVFTPVNEPSYFAWAGGEVGLFAPHLRGRGDLFKRVLVRAAVLGTEAVRREIPGAGILTVDPICRTVAPPGRPELAGAVRDFNRRVVFQSLDALSGRIWPELGGRPDLPGTIGVNYYWTNQWELDGEPGPLREDDPRRVPLRDILRAVHRRYRRPLILSETSHVGDRRAGWIREAATEVLAAREAGVPVLGICLYPVLSMPEWHRPEEWTPLGLWDLRDGDGRLRRIPHAPALEAVREIQEQVGRSRGEGGAACGSW